jgi:hypothetical protein
MEGPTKAAKGWQKLGTRLWASSFAMPEDDTSDIELDGKPLSSLINGSHLTETGAVIHHQFLHPCYMTFSLLSNPLRQGPERAVSHSPRKISLPVTSNPWPAQWFCTAALASSPPARGLFMGQPN